MKNIDFKLNIVLLHFTI